MDLDIVNQEFASNPRAIFLFSCFVFKLMGIMLISKRRNKHKFWKNRRWWVRPINLQRDNPNNFIPFMEELKNDADHFFRYTRMTLEIYNNLLKKISPFLKKNSLRKALTPEQRLIITLRFIAGGESIFSIALHHHVGESTVRAIIVETCSIIIDRLSLIYLKQPNERDWLRISEGFSQIWNMPNCVGAIDGKHVSIQAPSNSGSLYFNYKKTFSIVFLAVCDHEYKFTLVDIGAYGSESDGGIFNRSEIGQGIKNNTLHLPPNSASLPGSNIKTAYYFVGDAAFELSRHLMKPFPGKHLTKEKKIYNYRLSRARRMIESSFGILVSRWRILSKPIRMNIDKVEKIITACVCLHNFIISMESEQLDISRRYLSSQNCLEDNNVEPYQTIDNNHLLPLAAIFIHRATDEAYQQRNNLVTWMNSPQGEVIWQYDYISRGTYKNSL